MVGWAGVWVGTVATAFLKGKVVMGFLGEAGLGWAGLWWGLGVVMVAAFGVGESWGQTYPLREAVECSPRAGLPNAMANMKAGEAVKVDYFGGSITAQPGYRVKSLAWLGERYPEAKFSEVNAAIGGTGSNIGAFRMEQDVLEARPDLIFVEFAVNDSGASTGQIRGAMEGIVRQAWAALPGADLCFVYTIKDADIAGLQAGTMKRSASVMEEVADYYGIPSIHLGVAVAELVRQGKVVMKGEESAQPERVSGDELNESSGRDAAAGGPIAFSKDGVHPYLDTGHALYMDAIARSWPAIEAASGPAGSHELGEPLDPAHWQAAQQRSIDAAMLTGPAEAVDLRGGEFRGFSQRLDSLWKLEPGATLSFAFRGSHAMIYDVIGPGTGQVQVEVDGRLTTQERFDKYCTYWRLSAIRIAEEADPAAVHRVKLTVLDEPLDKAEILRPNHPDAFAEDPEKFAGRAVYLGRVMLVGELVEDDEATGD